MMIRADDYTSLAAAVAAAVGTFDTPGGIEPHGQIVQLGPHDYTLDAERLVIPAGVTLRGEGAQSTRIRCYNGGGADMARQMDSAGILENAWMGNAITDLRLENQTATNAAPAVLFEGGGGSRVSGLTINGFGVGLDLWGCDEVDVDGCYFGSYTNVGFPGPDSIGIRFRGEANANSVMRCKMNGPYTSIAHDGGACNNIIACRFNNPGHTIIRSANELAFSHCYWEAATAGEFVLVDGAPGQVVAYGLRFRNCYYAGSKVAVRFAAGTVTYGFGWTDSQLAGTALEGTAIAVGDIYCLPSPSDLRGSVYLGGGTILPPTAGGVLS